MGKTKSHSKKYAIDKMTLEYCGDCGHQFEKGQIRIFWKGKHRCEKCDKVFNEKDKTSPEEVQD